MTSPTSTFFSPAPRGHRRSGAETIKIRLALGALKKLTIGRLEMRLPDGETRLFEGAQRANDGFVQTAVIEIHDWRALSMTLSKGDIGFGEAYMQGLWSTPDLVLLLRLVAVNRDAMQEMIYGRWWSVLIDRIRHALRGNRRRQARKNISAHYDLGNAFYRLWLDPTMTYSSALFDRAPDTAVSPGDLQAAQERKIDRAIGQLGLKEKQTGGDASFPSVLEVGCGWGSLARRLSRQIPCRYVGLTLSVEQKAFAEALLASDCATRAEIRLQDYRDIREEFDGIISIEMFEAVGEAYWKAYFEMLARCLKPGARAVIQTITIDERLFDRYRIGTDFIQQYIFPGGMLPSKSVFRQHARAVGLVIEDEFFFGKDYALTLHQWLGNIEDRQQEIRTQGFDDEFLRMWRFYLAYCEAGFAQSSIDVGQFTLRRPDPARP